MRAAGASTKLSSGITDSTARAARAAVTLSIRRSLPSTVARATESAGKLVSHNTTSSPCPMARSACSTSALSSGSISLSKVASRPADFAAANTGRAAAGCQRRAGRRSGLRKRGRCGSLGRSIRGKAMRAASIGECMVEFHRRPDGSYGRGFGGDTLNVALYMARLGISTDYVTLLGDDPLSQEMVDGWAAEGVGIGLVGRIPGRLPGLYLIETDAKRRAHLPLLAQRRASARPDGPSRRSPGGRTRRPRARLPLRHHPVPVRRRRARAAGRGPGGPAPRRRPGRVRRQFPPPRLARPGDGA